MPHRRRSDVTSWLVRGQAADGAGDLLDEELEESDEPEEDVESEEDLESDVDVESEDFESELVEESELEALELSEELDVVFDPAPFLELSRLSFR